MKYKLLKASIPSYLNDDVNCHLEDGWELHGSPIATKDYYLQGVVLKGKLTTPNTGPR
jgi:hypothetical protein